jgi:hypothetical protein
MYDGLGLTSRLEVLFLFRETMISPWEELMKLKVLALVATIFTLLGVHAQAAYVVGDTIADFTLNDAYGNPVSLSDYDGMVVWLDFWTDT